MIPLATYQKLCLDAVDHTRMGKFWAAVLGWSYRPTPNGEGAVFGPTDEHTIWMNRVPEPKTVKNRVHLDIYTTDLASLERLGATLVQEQQPGWGWTIMADPEGGEFCAFVRDELPPERLHGLVVDCVDPAAQAQWWAGVLGGSIVPDERGFSTVEHVPGMPILTYDFVAVPEPKTAKNRVHIDLDVPDRAALVATGARLLDPPTADRRWAIMADPEGNEFCAFPTAG
jgi:predicted enzyme related to lactoylglutathione lyase